MQMYDRTSQANRRGVASVLAMMFLVIFSSLAAAMAVVAQGNLRTADSHMKVSRAMSAAETGLVFAKRRLLQESQRFVATEGDIDASYGALLWDGEYPNDGSVLVLVPNGYTEPSLPDGIAEAMLNAHLADAHTITPEPGDSALPVLDANHTLFARPIALTAHSDGTPQADGPYFRLTYEMLIPETGEDNTEAYVRVTSKGYDQNITRTLVMEFRINKRIEYAIISPNRIMIGKNVRVEGPLGSRYGLISGELDTENGDPLVMRSDFYFLDPALDANLDVFFAQLALHDADGDGRLRIYHTTEGQAALEEPGVIIDTDGNEYVDDFDLFMAQFDINGDGMVVYD